MNNAGGQAGMSSNDPHDSKEGVKTLRSSWHGVGVTRSGCVLVPTNGLQPTPILLYRGEKKMQQKPQHFHFAECDPKCFGGPLLPPTLSPSLLDPRKTRDKRIDLPHMPLSLSLTLSHSLEITYFPAATGNVLQQQVWILFNTAHQQPFASNKQKADA